MPPRSLRRCTVFGSDGHQPLADGSPATAVARTSWAILTIAVGCEEQLLGRQKIQSDLGDFSISINSLGSGKRCRLQSCIHVES